MVYTHKEYLHYQLHLQDPQPVKTPVSQPRPMWGSEGSKTKNIHTLHVNVHCEFNYGREICACVFTHSSYLHPHPPLAQTLEVELLGKTSFLETKFLQLMQFLHSYMYTHAHTEKRQAVTKNLSRLLDIKTSLTARHQMQSNLEKNNDIYQKLVKRCINPLRFILYSSPWLHNTGKYSSSWLHNIGKCYLKYLRTCMCTYHL